MRLDGQFLAMALADLEIISPGSSTEYSFSIDTRSLQAGQVFIAIPGQRVDGHAYLQKAIDLGAAGLLIEKNKKDLLALISPVVQKKLFIGMVSNTVESLLHLAHIWRSQFTIPVIGITGSMGKTSTKEILSTILNLAGMKHISSIANQNTKIGIALNLLRLRAEHKAAIIEMGISQRGEMAELAHLVRPTSAIITTIGHSHVEGLGSLPDIALEKRDIFKYFNEQSIGIINGDVPFLSGVSYIHPVIKFGCKTINQVQARKIQMGALNSSFVLKLYKNKYQVKVAKGHEGAIYNALAAATAAYLLNISTDIILKGIQQEVVVEGRFQERQLKGHAGVLINDCYNANPESMKAALLAFEKYDSKSQKIAILGDMLELGVNSPFWHRQIGRFLRKVPSLKRVILVGDMVKWIKKTAPVSLPVEQVATWQEALALVQTYLTADSVLLVKGSHGMKLANLVEAISVEPVKVHKHDPVFKAASMQGASELSQ